uniref:hypothetical protein n=1 Tax=Streptomyces sp. CC228A TaxID=2898186 RepID=UPI001F37D9BE
MSVSPTAWLAQADPDPDRASRWLAQAAVVVLPVGTSWDAVKVPRELGAGIELARITGPVIHDPHGAVLYFLVPPGTRGTWAVDGTECLSAGTWLSAPAPTVTVPPGPHWLRPPAGDGALTDPAALAAELQ